MTDQRFIIIGAGGISEEYVKAASSLEHVQIAGVVGRNADKTRVYAEKHQIPFHGTTLADVAEQAQATAVIICTPPALHSPYVIEAAKLGLHCLCEKPLDVSVEAQHAMVDACKEQGVFLGVSYIIRLSNHMRYLKELLDSGALGRILSANATLQTFRESNYYTESSWHGKKALDGGGAFLGQGSHIIDIAQWLMDGYQSVTEARCFNLVHDIEVEDSGYAIVKWGNGAVGMVEASTAYRGGNVNALEIFGTKGHIAANFGEFTTFNVEGMDAPEEFEGIDFFKELMSDFTQAIEEGREPFVSGESAQIATELILDIYAKAEATEKKGDK